MASLERLVKLGTQVRWIRTSFGCRRFPIQVITQRYLKSSIVMTTNLGVGSWGKIFDDPMVAAAMLDRLLHRSVVFNIDGESYRMRSHRARTEGLRKGVSKVKE